MATAGPYHTMTTGLNHRPTAGPLNLNTGAGDDISCISGIGLQLLKTVRVSRMVRADWGRFRQITSANSRSCSLA
jgi:hypothetical protein